MNFQSILYRDLTIEPQINLAEPSCFKDLNLDQIVSVITKGKTDLHLDELFFTPLNDLNEINFRQEIFRDLEDTALRKYVKDFAVCVYRTSKEAASIRETMLGGEIYKDNYLQKGRLLSLYEQYSEALITFNAALKKSKLRSQGMRSFTQSVAEYVQSAAFISLCDETAAIRLALAKIKYNMLIKSGTVKVRKFDGEPNHSLEIERLFAKFKQGDIMATQAKPERDSFAEHVEAQILELVKKWHPDVFERLDQYCITYKDCISDKFAAFSRDVQFYLTYLAYISNLRSAGLSFCYPEMSTHSKDIYSRGSFDIALAYNLTKDAQGIVTNDFELSGHERIIIVSGPNQGGKTTFARTFGQLHHFASLGCCVAGSEAKLYLPDQILTHFECEEHVDTLSGKLQDDLIRIHDILSRATGRSIIIINEILASTSLKDGVLIGKRLMDKIIDMDSICVCVTFLVELATYKDRSVSMVSKVVPDDPSLRTFKIVRQPADGLAYATFIASKYGLTYENIKERIQA